MRIQAVMAFINQAKVFGYIHLIGEQTAFRYIRTTFLHFSRFKAFNKRQQRCKNIYAFILPGFVLRKLRKIINLSLQLSTKVHFSST